MEETKNDTPVLIEASTEKEPMEEEPPAKPSPKSQEKVNGSMDMFTRSRTAKQSAPRKKRVKKTREVVDKNGFSCIL